MVMTGCGDYKVLFICPSMNGGGVERSVLNLMKSFSRKAIDITLGLLKPQGEFLEEAHRYPVIFPKSRSGKKHPSTYFKGIRNVFDIFVSFFTARELVKRVQPDIIVTFTLEATIPMGFSAGLLRKSNITWIISEGSNTAESVKLVSSDRLFVMFYRRFIGWIFNKAGFVVPVSKGVGKQVEKDYRIRSEKIFPIYNPVDTDTIHNKTVEKLEIEIGSRYILAIGRLVKVKGFDLLIRSFSLLRELQEVKLVILGEGPERKRLQALITKLDLESRILMPGFMKNPWVFMRHSEFLVVSSLYEGFCNVIAEGMAAGTPVLSTACNYGPKEVIENCTSGKLVPVGDVNAMSQEMQQLLEDEALRNQLRKNGEKRAASFSMDRIADQYLNLFDFAKNRPYQS